MTIALTSPVREPRQCLEGLVEIAGHLADDLNVTISYTELTPDDIGTWDSSTRCLQVRCDALMEDQLWLMTQAWLLLTIGPWASPVAIRDPILRLLPDVG